MEIENLQCNRPHPANWGKDSLSCFIESTHQNTLTTFVNHKPIFSELQKISDSFDKAISHLNNVDVEERQVVFFILRAHSAYLAGLRLSTGGQACEAYMVLRGCLEAGLYGYFLHQNPDKVEIWLRRHNDDKSKKAVRDSFKIGTMLSLLERECSKTGKHMKRLYEECIDYGAHPNEKSMTSNLMKRKEENYIVTGVVYVNGGGVPMRRCIEINAQVGLCVLKTFEEIFPARFKITKLDKEIERLSKWFW